MYCLQSHAHFTLRAAADVVPADPSELLFVLAGGVGATAAVICHKQSSDITISEQDIVYILDSCVCRGMKAL